jgi:hypothetical protein
MKADKLIVEIEVSKEGFLKLAKALNDNNAIVTNIKTKK